jgi:hypothetical protein
MSGMTEEKPWVEHEPASVMCTITADPSDAHDYDEHADIGFRDVPADAVAEFVASIPEGIGERGLRAMHAIADDETHGPLHLVRLVCSAEVAARAVGGGLLAGESRSARVAQLITHDVSPAGLHDLVTALRSEGLHAATEVARAMTPQERVSVLDALSNYVGRFFTAALHGPELFFEVDRG